MCVCVCVFVSICVPSVCVVFYQGHGLVWADEAMAEDVRHFVQAEGPGPSSAEATVTDADMDRWGNCIWSYLCEMIVC